MIDIEQGPNPTLPPDYLESFKLLISDINQGKLPSDLGPCEIADDICKLAGDDLIMELLDLTESDIWYGINGAHLTRRNDFNEIRGINPDIERIRMAVRGILLNKAFKEIRQKTNPS